MKERIIFGGIGAVLAICAFLFAGENLILALVAVISLLAVTEFLKASSLLCKSKLYINILTYILAVGLIVSLSIDNALLKELWKPTYGYTIPVIVIYIILSFAVMVLNHSKINFSDVAVSMLGTVYIVFSLMHICFLRSLPDGKIFLWLPFIIAWLTDTFAYFTGVFFGKHKLIPSVSPKKTVEGAIGGVAGAVITIVVYQLICQKIMSLEPDYIMGIVMALVCSVASMFGDLAASCIKREHGVKDFGSIMPGHGGVLDRFDSVIYISPVVFYFIQYIGIF